MKIRSYILNEKIALAPLSYLRSRKAIVSARGAAIGKVTDKIKKLRSGGKNINQVSKAIKQTQKELTNINKQLLNKKNVQWWDVPGRYSRGRQMKQVSHLRSKLDVLKNRLKRTVLISAKKSPVFNVKVGNEKQNLQEVADNILTVLEFVIKRLPKGEQNLKHAYLKTSMGESVKLM